MDEPTIEHLKLIQAVITRLAQNSFTYKGWTLTLVTALIALSVEEISSPYLLAVALLPTLAFWGLDAYYLRQERLFRALYDGIRTRGGPPPAGQAFSMDTTPYRGQEASWWKTCWSRTIGWLYGPIVVVILVITGLTMW
jgi:hypothetical protein